jgi:hypothetical protein
VRRAHRRISATPDVEGTVVEGKALRAPAAEIGARDPCAARLEERLRRLDARHALRAEAACELGDDAARPAADVERGVALANARRLAEVRGERGGVAADAAGVRVGSRLEAHAPILLPPPALDKLVSHH